MQDLIINHSQPMTMIRNSIFSHDFKIQLVDINIKVFGATVY